MQCERLSFVPDTPDDDLVLLHQYHVSETYAMHSHVFYEVFYVTKGQAMHEINSSSQVVGEGSLVFIRPDDAHYYKQLNISGFEFINVNIVPELVEQAFKWVRIPKEYFDDPALPPTIKLSGAQHLEMRRKFIELSLMPSGPARRRQFCALLPEIIVLIYSQEDMDKTQVVPDWLSDVLQRLEQPDCFTKGLPELLRMTPYTQEHLTRSFRKYVHISPTAYINQKRLGYAAELLLSKPLTPPQVAQDVGFNNLSHFYHLFKQQYGCTPLQYTVQYRNIQVGQMKRLLCISRDAAQQCIGNNATKVSIKNGLFAYYTQYDHTHIFISFDGEITDQSLAELSACWDPRITAGATLHINGENQELLDFIIAKYERQPIWQAQQLVIPLEKFQKLWSCQRDERVRFGRYNANQHEVYMQLLDPLFAPGFQGESYDQRSEALRTLWTAQNAPRSLLSIYDNDRLVGAAYFDDEGIKAIALLPHEQHDHLMKLLLYEALLLLFETGKLQCYINIPDNQPDLLNLCKQLYFTQSGHEVLFHL